VKKKMQGQLVLEVGPSDRRRGKRGGKLECAKKVAKDRGGPIESPERRGWKGKTR